MIVLDASALVELALATPTGLRVAGRISDAGEGLHTPHLADLEVAQVLRRYWRQGLVSETEAVEGLAALRNLGLRRHAHEPLLERIWNLRANLTAYDAVYVALAEALPALLLTCDRKLAHTPGVGARIQLVS